MSGCGSLTRIWLLVQHKTLWQYGLKKLSLCHDEAALTCNVPLETATILSQDEKVGGINVILCLSHL